MSESPLQRPLPSHSRAESWLLSRPRPAGPSRNSPALGQISSPRDGQARLGTDRPASKRTGPPRDGYARLGTDGPASPTRLSPYIPLPIIVCTDRTGLFQGLRFGVSFLGGWSLRVWDKDSGFRIQGVGFRLGRHVTCTGFRWGSILGLRFRVWVRGLGLRI